VKIPIKISGLIFILAAWLFLPSVASAQFTTVSACVVDPTLIPYSFGTVTAIITPASPGGYRLLGQPYSGQLALTALDKNGCFTANMGDNGQITPGGSQWTITVGISPGIALPFGNGPQSFNVTMTITGVSQNISVALNAVATKLTNFAGTGTGTIAGTVTAFHIPYVSAGNTLSDIVGSAVTGATGAIGLTAGADTTTPLAVNSHSNTQSANLLDINNQSGGTPNAPVVFRGRGFGSFDPGAATTVVNIQQESNATAQKGLVLTNRQAVGSSSALSTLELWVSDAGIASIFGGNAVGDALGQYGGLSFDLGPGTGVTAILGNTGQLNEVPFAILNQTVSSNANLFNISNSGGLVADFDKNGNFVDLGTGGVTASAGPLTSGAVGTNGVLSLKGATSGAATWTAPAVAGTTSNGVTMSNVLLGPNGAASAPTYSFSGFPTYGMYTDGGGSVIISSNGVARLTISNTAVSSSPLLQALTSVQSPLYTTPTNCSSSASPAVCGASAAGSVAVPTGTNATLQVNTTAVTANSQIFVQSDDTLGTKLSVTCNSTLASLIVEPVVTARVGGTSFTITISGTTTTNPVCLSYFIVN
jgi:hypothetical protein